jgi:hypothetical protein
MLTPFQYVKKYHNLWTPQFIPWFTDAGFYGVGAIQTPVKEYCNSRYTNKAGKSPSERFEFKDSLLRFFKKRAQEADSGVLYTKGDGYCLSSAVTIKPIYDFERRFFMEAFAGKASPEKLDDMIQLISYWHRYQVAVENKTLLPVPVIVSSYLGVDCNGFIGNYLKAKYAGCSLGPSDTERTYHNRGSKGRRKKFREIRMDDVIVFSGFGHVALVQDVIDWGDDWAVVEICESRSKTEGGPQWSIEEINWQKNSKGQPKEGHFRMRGRDLESISDVRYV